VGTVGLIPRERNGQKLHGDVNGAYNIIRKAIPDAFAEGIEGLALVPVSVAVMNDFTTGRNKTAKF
jgi:putative transposase